jgi:hypothetical protein
MYSRSNIALRIVPPTAGTMNRIDEAIRPWVVSMHSLNDRKPQGKTVNKEMDQTSIQDSRGKETPYVFFGNNNQV